ncbi:hypothetical protein E2C01_007486 [Portunus trituberculatus]|uniref:Uncharacterized protein n=1 Tax=Portunus trituberculatus TaxID=210409 RepID=A0A5B7D097_PORTR|nr:hypothetical protein [Portunus trituberculatus]
MYKARDKVESKGKVQVESIKISSPAESRYTGRVPTRPDKIQQHPTRLTDIRHDTRQHPARPDKNQQYLTTPGNTQ